MDNFEHANTCRATPLKNLGTLEVRKNDRYNREDCEGVGGQLFKGTCYQPFSLPKRRPTSSPMKDP